MQVFWCALGWRQDTEMKMKGPGEQLRALAALSENLSGSQHSCLVAHTCNSSSRGPGSLGHLYTGGIYSYKHSHVHINRNKNKSGKWEMKRRNVMERNSRGRICTDYKSIFFLYPVLTNSLKLIFRISPFDLFSHGGIWLIIRSKCILIILNSFPTREGINNYLTTALRVSLIQPIQ